MIRFIAFVAGTILGIGAVASVSLMRHITPFEAFVVFALSAIGIEAALAATKT